MPVIVDPIYWSVARCRKLPRDLFVFGDNLQRTGTGGQAVIRYEPNAIGLITKRRPSWSEDAFLVDDDLRQVERQNDRAVETIEYHLTRGHTVRWPGNGLGTGRAQLAQRAPVVIAYYERLLKQLDWTNWTVRR